MIGELSSIPSGGGKPVGKEGGQQHSPRDVKLVWPEFHTYFGRGFNIPHKNAMLIEFYASA